MKKGIEFPENPKEEEYDVGQILELAPAELVDFLVSLDQQGRLESFLEMASNSDSLVAQLSYWEKWLKKEHADLLDNVIEKKKDIYPGETDSLPIGLDERFNEQELQAIFSNVGAIQLTFGCSKGCPFCGLDAVKGVREHIPYEQLETIFRRYGDLLYETEPVLYWASEPSDYASKVGLEDKTYEDVQELAERYADFVPFVSSREVNNKVWIDFLAKSGNERLSVYGLSDKKKEAIKKMVEGRIELAGANKGQSHTRGIGVSSQKYDSAGTIGIGWCRDSVVLTPRGIYNVVMTLISKKYPQGEIVVPIEAVDRLPEIGESIDSALRHCLIKHRDRPLPNSMNINVCVPLNSPAIRVLVGEKEYDISVDRNGRVKKVLPSNEELDDLAEQRREVANELYDFASGGDKIELRRKLTELEEKIEPIVYARIDEYDNYNLALGNIFSKYGMNALRKTGHCFKVERDKKTGNAFLRVIQSENESPAMIDMFLEELNQPIDFEVVSQADARLNNFLGQIMSIEDVDSKLGNDLLFKLTKPRKAS